MRPRFRSYAKRVDPPEIGSEPGLNRRAHSVLADRMNRFSHGRVGTSVHPSGPRGAGNRRSPVVLYVLGCAQYDAAPLQAPSQVASIAPVLIYELPIGAHDQASTNPVGQHELNLASTCKDNPRQLPMLNVPTLGARRMEIGPKSPRGGARRQRGTRPRPASSKAQAPVPQGSTVVREATPHH